MAEKVRFNGMTPGQIATQANIKADLSLGIDDENYPNSVVRHLRDDEDLSISLSNEIAIHRHLLFALINTLKLKEFPDGLLKEFEDYYQKAETAKNRAKEEQSDVKQIDE